MNDATRGAGFDVIDAVSLAVHPGTEAIYSAPIGLTRLVSASSHPPTASRLLLSQARYPAKWRSTVASSRPKSPSW